MKSFCTTIILASILSVSLSACSPSDAITNPTPQIPKNIIMIVGDGMGPAYTTAYRYYADSDAKTKSTQAINTTIFDRHHIGSATTYPARISGYVTDSAAAATALAAGVKSYNGAIAVDINKKPVLTVLEWAKQQGKKTGIVVTSHINHATPASYMSHNESRDNYAQIADSYFDEKINGQFKADVMLGGGWKHFIRDDRNLVEEFKQQGYQYIDKLEQLDSIAPNKPLLGLFADEGLPWQKDSKPHNRLAAMSKVAIRQLENPNGYFLLLEASLIDWAGHQNNISAAMGEMRDLAVTLNWLDSYVKNNPDTLVVLTADHNTGGLTLGANGVYDWRPKTLHGLPLSPTTIAKKLTEKPITRKQANELFGFVLNDKEFKQLSSVELVDESAMHNKINRIDEDEYSELRAIDVTSSPGMYTDKGGDYNQLLALYLANTKAMYSEVKYIIDSRTSTGWTTGAHTGIDVQVFSFGQQSEMFFGHQDNTDIGKKIFKLLGK